MNTRRWRLLSGVIAVIVVAALTVAASRPHPAAGVAGPAPDPTCTSSLPCIEYDNNSTGPGIRGVGFLGSGVSGRTKFNSTSAANARAGVIGNDLSTSGIFDSGVLGVSVRGTGVSGQSTSGPGVSAISSTGVGVQATSSSWTGANIIGGYSNSGLDEFFPALSITGSSAGGFLYGTDLIDACQVGISSVECYSNNALFRVDYLGDVISSKGNVGATNGQFSGALSVGTFTLPASGDINITGEYLKAGSCVSGCVAATKTSAGRAVGSYAAQETVPSIEDFGEAQVVNGQARVSLGADFVNVIDGRANYMVFITPEGDNRGVYVSNKTPSGFAVHESQGGRSTFAFSYRVVAKPFGAARPRLPVVVESLGPRYMVGRAWHAGSVVPVR